MDTRARIKKILEEEKKKSEQKDNITAETNYDNAKDALGRAVRIGTKDDLLFLAADIFCVAYKQLNQSNPDYLQKMSASGALERMALGEKMTFDEFASSLIKDLFSDDEHQDDICTCARCRCGDENVFVPEEYSVSHTYGYETKEELWWGRDRMGGLLFQSKLVKTAENDSTVTAFVDAYVPYVNSEGEDGEEVLARDAVRAYIEESVETSTDKPKECLDPGNKTLVIKVRLVEKELFDADKAEEKYQTYTDDE